MKVKPVKLATARVKGLNKHPYYWEHHCYFAWDFRFYDTSTLLFCHPLAIYMGKTEEEAEEFLCYVKENFEKVGIKNCSKVDVLYERDGHVRAIGKKEHDVWIDMDDRFSIKTLMELHIRLVP